MEIREFYEIVGGSYDAAINRFRNDDRILKFVRMFVQDTSMASLKEAFEAGDIPTAFRAVHTLKGVVLNIDFGNLARAASALTEALRSVSVADKAATAQLYSAVCEEYDKAIAVIGMLDD